MDQASLSFAKEKAPQRANAEGALNDVPGIDPGLDLATQRTVDHGAEWRRSW